MKAYGHPAPGVDVDELGGRFVVIEGPDAVGRSTQIDLLTQALEARGHAVATAGLSRSRLAGPELEEAKQGNLLRPRTMALFYAADLFDQLENNIVPSLRAGCVVLADRYIHSLMARAVVRGLDPAWLEKVYAPALVPDQVFYLRASPKRLEERMLHKHGRLDFWEAGMDMGLSSDWHDSFLTYQRRLRRTVEQVGERFPYQEINANRAVMTIHKDLLERVVGLVRA